MEGQAKTQEGWCDVASRSQIARSPLARGLAAGFSVLLAATALATPGVAQAATTEELQAQLEEARARVETLEGQVRDAAAEYESAQADLEQTESDISQINEQIEENSAELEQLRSTLSELVAFDYKNQSDALTALLGVSSFDELLSTMHYLSAVSEDRSDLIAQTTELQETLNAQEQELEQKRSDQEAQAEELSQDVASLTSAQQEQQAYVDGLSAEVQEQLEAERQAAIEAERKAAQEAVENSGSGSGGGSAGNDDAPSKGSGAEKDDGSSPSKPSNPSKPTSKKQAAVDAALSMIGKPYVTNGDSPSEGFDCSGLVWWAYQQAGVSIPRSQRTGMYPACRNSGTWTTNVYNLSPGDLIFYGPAGSTTHVALYIGDGRIVHADGTRVSVSRYDYTSSFLGGGSIL